MPPRCLLYTSILRTTVAMFGAFALFSSLVGCSGNPVAGSPAYKEGELGNGDFLFACDDSVACHKWSNNAKNFPTEIATGSNFEIRFVAKGEQGSSNTIFINEKRYEGIKTEPLPPFVSSGPEGLSAQKPGFGSVVARDNTGVVIDYVTLKIVQPDGLVVYDAKHDAATSGDNPLSLQSLSLKVGDLPSYRVVAEHKLEAIAGSVNVKWESDNPTVIEVVSYTRGVVNFRAKAAGTAKLKATGAALTKELSVEVTP